MAEDDKKLDAVDPGSSAPPVLVDAAEPVLADPAVADHVLDETESANKASYNDWDGTKHAALDHAKHLWAQLGSRAEHDLDKMVEEVLTIAKKVEAYLRGQ